MTSAAETGMQQPGARNGTNAALSEEYMVEDVAPMPEEYHTLRKASGLTPPPRDRLEIALKNSILATTIRLRETAQAVAMGRVIGDGGVFLFVTDMATLPQHQRKGLGAYILQRLLAQVDAEYPNVFLALSADPPGVRLYERNGFEASTKEKIMYRTR